MLTQHSGWLERGLIRAAAIVTCLATTCQAAPAISKLSLRGLQTGATTTLAVDGADLGPDTQIVLPVPIARQEIKPSASASHVEIDVTLDVAVIPGIYSLRVANGHGISNSVLVGVDQLAQRPFAADAGQLPVALHGILTGGTILRTTFDGKAGQQIVVDAECQRLGSKLNPVLHLSDARNAQIAWSQIILAIGADARIAATLPADGRYTVELHDALYRGAEPGEFRLKIGELHYADLVYPLGGKRGAKALVEFVGTNLPVGERIEADLGSAAADVPANWPAGQLLTGCRPRILVGDLPEIEELAVGPSLQVVSQPVAINGRLLAPLEEDRFLVTVTPGQTLRFDVLAARAGSPLDGVLLLRKESGEQLAAADDSATSTDPTLDFKVPDGVEKVVVVVKDLLARGGSDYVYRLAIAAADRPDFRLQLFGNREQVPSGGAEIVRVRRADRLHGSYQIGISRSNGRHYGGKRRDSGRRDRCPGVTTGRRRSRPLGRERCRYERRSDRTAYAVRAIGRNGGGEIAALAAQRGRDRSRGQRTPLGDVERRFRRRTTAAWQSGSSQGQRVTVTVGLWPGAACARHKPDHAAKGNHKGQS